MLVRECAGAIWRRAQGRQLFYGFTHSRNMIAPWFNGLRSVLSIFVEQRQIGMIITMNWEIQQIKATRNITLWRVGQSGPDDPTRIPHSRLAHTTYLRLSAITAFVLVILPMA